MYGRIRRQPDQKRHMNTPIFLENLNYSMITYFIILSVCVPHVDVVVKGFASELGYRLGLRFFRDFRATKHAIFCGHNSHLASDSF